MSKTMTQVIHDNQNAGETMTEAVHRMQKPGETMSQAVKRVQSGGTPPPAHVPAPPTGFADPTSSAVTATGFKVSWAAPTGGDPVTGYKVSVKTGGADITGSPFSMAGSTLSKTVSGLTTATDYKVIVTATNADGSIDSNEITITTA